MLVYFIVTLITEMATWLPIYGGTMSYYGYRYVSRSMDFAIWLSVLVCSWHLGAV
jgi:yeast amino acid transporter